MNRRRLGRILATVAVAVAVLSITPAALGSVATRTETSQPTLASDRAAYTDVLTVQLALGLLLIYPLASLAFRPARRRHR